MTIIRLLVLLFKRPTNVRRLSKVYFLVKFTLQLVIYSTNDFAYCFMIFFDILATLHISMWPAGEDPVLCRLPFGSKTIKRSLCGHPIHFCLCKLNVFFSF